MQNPIGSVSKSVTRFSKCVTRFSKTVNYFLKSVTRFSKNVSHFSKSVNVYLFLYLSLQNMFILLCDDCITRK